MSEYEVLKALAGFADPEVDQNAKVAKLLSFSGRLLNINVGRCIMADPGAIDEVLYEAMRLGKISDDQFVGLAFAAMMAGGRHWDTLAHIIHNKPDRPELVKRIQGHLQGCGIPRAIAVWLVQHSAWLEHGLHKMVLHLMDHPTSKPAKCLTFSKAISFGDRCDEVKTLFEAHGGWLLHEGHVMENIDSMPEQEKISLDDLYKLLTELASDANDAML